jgi:uncharacterized membrane protein
MESKKNKNQVISLPVYFKWIGIVLMVISAGMIGYANLNDLDLTGEHERFKVLTLSGFILGAFFLAFARDKEEDERLMALKLRSLAISFSWAVIMVVIRPVLDIVFGDEMAMMSSQTLVLSMLIAYLIVYYLQKRNY